MYASIDLLVDFSVIALFLLAVRQFRTPEAAVRGNLTAAAALGLAVLVTVARSRIGGLQLVLPVVLAGSALGWVAAVRVNMVQIPAMVAVQNGAGGLAAFLISLIELLQRSGEGPAIQEISGLIGLTLGGATFVASMVAAGKLADVLKQAPTVLAGHLWWVGSTIVAACVLSAISVAETDRIGLFTVLGLLAVASGILGVLVSIRTGGADMPVLISFLNAASGLAAAFCGVVVANRLLVACGATVAASGTVLTLAMCQAMNRSLWAVLAGFRPDTAAGRPQKDAAGFAETSPRSGTEQGGDTATPLEQAVEACRQARSIVIVPGYGMAMAGAQFEVVRLGRMLLSQGKQVSYAVHPVAGRMPGHMYVLLAEAEVPYELLHEPSEINPLLPDTDLAVVVGASDVVNPAATQLPGTPISGMPIVNVAAARRILIINLNDAPGYSGVRNLLYDQPGVILLWGDAKESLQKLIDALERPRT
ncbi:MAG TPA: NAD(P)(+) transhydrogenase (Re/Si-specific) subunit beta [Acidobacteriota bacterium]|nr:NAD(P)(+) transhydrogenase (Re/Si-specific) subunit beta [Acidobacteriota bacterium]